MKINNLRMKAVSLTILTSILLTMVLTFIVPPITASANIPAETISLPIPVTTPYVVTISAWSRLNVRAEDSVRSERVGTLRRNDVVQVIAISGDWAQIHYTDEHPIAFVAARFIKQQ